MTNKCLDEEVGRLITFYELNQLSEPDCDRFEHHLLECQFCYQELQEMRPLVTTLRADKEQILKELAGEGIRLADEKQALLSTSKRHSSASKVETCIGKLQEWWENLTRPVVWVPATAAVVVLLILVLPTLRAPNPYLPYLDYSKAPYTHETFRGPAGLSEDARRLFDTGMAEYARDNYRETARYLEQAVQLASEASQIWLYLGISRYLDRRPKPAIEALTRALAAEDEIVQATARWYLAQAYLASGDAAKARPLLEKAVRQADDYAARAAKLLEQLNSIK